MSEVEKDVSLMDFVILVIRRRSYFLSGFLISLIISLVVISQKHEKESYISIFKISTAQNKPITEPREFISKIYNQFYYEEIVNSPSLLKTMRSTKITHPPGSVILRIETNNSTHQEALKFHQLVLSYLQLEDMKGLSSEKGKVQKEMLDLKSKNNELDLKEGLEYLKSKLSSITLGVVLLESGPKSKIERGSHYKDYVVGLVLSLMVGCLMVFFKEGVDSIRIRLRESVKI